MIFIRFILLGVTAIGVTCAIPLGYADAEFPLDVAKFKDRTGTDRELALLKAKYKDNDAVRRILGPYQEDIEAAK
jgi:hypothetical protein